MLIILTPDFHLLYHFRALYFCITGSPLKKNRKEKKINEIISIILTFALIFCIRAIIPDLGLQ